MTFPDMPQALIITQLFHAITHFRAEKRQGNGPMSARDLFK